MTRREWVSLAIAPGLGASGGDGRPVWLDHDGGWEDIAALLLLLRSPEVEVKGVTITPGIAAANVARERTLALLGELGEPKEKLREEMPGGGEMLVTGPLTRVAGMLAAGRPPRSVLWMGGAIRVAGNAEGGAEWNAHADAAALETVLLSQLPLTICPLDLTNAFPARADVIVNARTAIQRQVKKAYGEKGRYWWDELAAAAMVAPGLFARRTERVGMEAGGKLVADGRGRAVTRLSDCQAEGFQNLMKMAWHY